MSRLIDVVRERGGKIRSGADVPFEQNIDGVVVTWVHPRPARDDANADAYYPELDDNDNSIVLHLAFGDRTALLRLQLEERHFSQ